MTAPLVVTVGSPQSISFRIDATAVRSVIAGMPRVAYFWTRDFLGRSFGRHRATWLRTKGTKFGRGGDRGIKVTQVNESTGSLQPNEVRYSVSPAEERMPSSAAATRAITQLRASVETGNEILPVHEFGTDIRSARPMFIPVKTRPGNFKKWRAANPGARLKFLPSKRDDKTLVYEVQAKRPRGRPRKDAPPASEKLRLRWVLGRFVAMNPTLNLYGSWEALAADRDKIWRETADKMLRDFARADLRDL